MGKNFKNSKRQFARRRKVDRLADEVVPWWKKNVVYIGKRDVETWKGTLILVFIAGLAAALVWSANTGFHLSSSAAPASTVYFNPASTTTTVGSSFNLAAMINPGTNAVSALSLHITFDPSKMSLTSITPSSAFSTVLAGPTIDNTGGTASEDLAVPLGTSSVTTTSTIATFAFQALATGTNSAVSFTTSTIAAADGESGNVVVTLTGGTVTINTADSTPPSGGSITYANGYLTAASVALTVADGTDSQSGVNTASRIVQRKSATLSSGSCGSYGSWSTISTGGSYPNFTDTSVSSGNCYQYQYLVSDNVGNQATYTTTNVAKVDSAAPSGGSITYTTGYFTTGSVALTVADGTDGVSGVNTGSRTVQRKSATLSSGSCGSYGSWSTVSTGGSYPNFTDTTVSSGNCYQYQYLVSDNAGNQATYTGANTAKVDTAGPSGGSISYTNGYITATSVYLTVADGTDAASGVNTGSRTVQRKSATLSNGSCGSYGSWSTIAPSGTYPSLTDATAASGNCYKYQYLTSDNAGNQTTYTSSSAIEIDTATPTGGSLTYANGYNSAHSIALSAADGTDAASGMNTGSRVVQRRSATLSGASCGSYGSWSTVSTGGSYPNFTDTTVATGKCYQYQYLVSNNAGTQAAYTSSSAAEITYPADISLDGTVDIFDYNLLHQNFGSSTCGNVADMNGDCSVDIFDYNLLHTEFGESV